MAIVNMDLAELKQLEDKIKTLESENQKLIDNQKQVIVYHKHFNGKVGYGTSGKKKELNIIGFHTKRSPYDVSYQDFNEIVSMQELLGGGYLEINVTEDSSRTTKDYKNLSEVISEIRIEEEAKVSDKLHASLDRANKIEVMNETIVQDNEKEIIRLKKSHSEKLAEIKLSYSLENDSIVKDNEVKYNELLKTNEKEFNSFKSLEKLMSVKYEKLEKEFSDFKENKKTISLEEQIAGLKNEITRFKGATLLQRVFNKNGCLINK